MFMSVYKNITSSYLSFEMALTHRASFTISRKRGLLSDGDITKKRLHHFLIFLPLFSDRMKSLSYRTFPSLLKLTPSNGLPNCLNLRFFRVINDFMGNSTKLGMIKAQRVVTLGSDLSVFLLTGNSHVLAVLYTGHLWALLRGPQLHN